MHRPADPDQPRETPAAAPALPPAARYLRHHHAESLTRQAFDEVSRDTAGPVTAATVADDMALWFSVLAGEVPTPMLGAAFRARAAAHAMAGLSAEDSIVLHHVCVEILTRALVGTSSPSRSRTALETDVTTMALPPLRAATAAVMSEQGRQECETPPQHGAAPPSSPAVPPRWCLGAIQPRHSIREALRRFRADNPHAAVITAGTQVTVFTHHPPGAPEVLAPYALVPVENGDTAGAARRAALAAVIARHYRRSLTAEHVLPLVAALDLTARERDAFVTACLGPLHTCDRHRYLLDTLAAYLAHNLSTTAAARSLYIHRHTLAYRLRSIQELTGLDLYQPFDRLQAELALIFSRAEPVRALPRQRTA
ncbi:PucR family transcriptional regulator [Streptomyces sp. G5(2025)]|uniref:PucR family transcriptional regulator n=1 Tax=Streptomyces sp. G5(2025) TaxID=3406628 RepID=UPI003C1CA3FF